MTTCSIEEAPAYVLLSPRAAHATGAAACATEALEPAELAEGAEDAEDAPTAPSELSVADVRRVLASLRRGWEDHYRRGKPLYFSGGVGLPSAPDLSIEAFALRHVMSHHSRRPLPR